MTKKEKTNRNIGLAFDLLKQINENPALLKKIPKGAAIEFVEKDFPKIEKPSAKNKKRKLVHVKNRFDIK
jgi:hypothetical protein